MDSVLWFEESFLLKKKIGLSIGFDLFKSLQEKTNEESNTFDH